MKITKEQLKRIVREELEIVLEGPSSPSWADGFGSASDWGSMGYGGPPEKSAPKETPREIAKKIGDKIKQMDAWTNIQPDLAKQDVEDMLPMTMDLEDLANFLGDMEGYESVAKFIDLMD